MDYFFRVRDALGTWYNQVRPRTGCGHRGFLPCGFSSASYRVVLLFKPFPHGSFPTSLCPPGFAKLGGRYRPSSVPEIGCKSGSGGAKKQKVSPPNLIFPSQRRREGCAMQHQCPSLATTDYRLVQSRRIVGVNPI